MEILLFLIPVSLVISFFFLRAFIWAVKDGQFSDLSRHGESLIYDEEPEDFDKN